MVPGTVVIALVAVVVLSTLDSRHCCVWLWCRLVGVAPTEVGLEHQFYGEGGVLCQFLMPARNHGRGLETPTPCLHGPSIGRFSGFSVDSAGGGGWSSSQLLLEGWSTFLQVDRAFAPLKLSWNTVALYLSTLNFRFASGERLFIESAWLRSCPCSL